MRLPSGLEKAEKARLALKALMAKEDLTQRETAALLAKETGRPCALRTVQAWLAAPTTSTSLACPDWAVIELRRAVLRQKQETT
jgi:hypothetical protein